MKRRGGKYNRAQEMRWYYHGITPIADYTIWRCQGCNKDMWLVDRSWGSSTDYCSAECKAWQGDVSDRLVSVFRARLRAGLYWVDALTVADAFLEGPPLVTGDGIRSIQWRERLIEELGL